MAKTDPLHVGDAKTLRADLRTQSYSSGDWSAWADTTLTAATILVFEVGAKITGTADSGSASTVVDADLSAVADFYNGLIVEFTSGDNEDETRKISDYDGAGKLTFDVTTDPLPATPAADDTFTIHGYPIIYEQSLGGHDDGSIDGATAYFQLTKANGATATPRTIRAVIASSWSGADSNTDIETEVYTYAILPVM